MTDDIRVVDDPAELVELYAPDAVVHPYGLADLDEPFWSSSTWYRRGDAVVAALDLGGDDAVYAIAADDQKAAATLELLGDLADDLPEQYLITGPVGVTGPLRRRYAVEWVGPHVKMHLAEPDRLPVPDPRVEWLTREAAAEVVDLRATEQRRDEDVWADSVQPIFDAGLADVVEVDADLGDGLRLASTPGHTPGHTSLWLESDGAAAVVTGDLIHHPVQCAEPQWNEIGDVDEVVAEATRWTFLRQVADTDTLVLGTHFPARPAGRVITAGEAFRFVPA